MEKKTVSVLVDDVKVVKKGMRIELPFFFKHDISSDYNSVTVFGVILKDRCIEVTRTRPLGVPGARSWELEVEYGDPQMNISDRWQTKNRSTEVEFKKACNQMAKEITKYLFLGEPAGEDKDD